VDINHLHFSEPLWLCLVLVIPIVWLAYFFFYLQHTPEHRLDKFIDSHLLPYLLINQTEKKASLWKSLLLWSVVWSCLTLALAGPRWTFREIETFSKDQSLVILLDLSESMNATDTKPSRLVRAKQKIEDLLRASNGVKIGLIAFAADPHMITPLTEDKDTIRHLLPTLQTDLVYVQGSRLSSAFEMALTLLNSEPGHNKSLLVVSDGGFEDASAMTTAKNLAEKGIVIHTMGVGTLEGAPLQDLKGKIIKKNGSPLLSRLEKDTLNEISRIGKGHYLEAHYSTQNENIIFKELEQRAVAAVEAGKKSRLWDERFYFLIFPAIPIILWWFRKGALFGLTFLLLFTPLAIQLEAAELRDYFKNSEQRGEEALDHGDYETAIHTFQDGYRKGVAYYRAGHFEEAEKMFRESSRAEVASSAAYNLGNALVQQQKLKEAVAAYEDVLKKWPDHTKAKDNLELVKKMLEQQEQDPPPPDDQNKNKDENNSNEQESSQKDDEENNGDTEKENSDPKEDPSKAKEQKKHEAGAAKSQEEQNADAWLNQISNDPKKFMQNKFYIESKRNGTKEGIDPW
jgi:Ca-activated chloride channel homolog